MKTRHQQKPHALVSTSNLLYGGGPVETSPAVYIVYWGPEWSSGFSTCDSGGNCASSGQAQNYVNTFFGNVGGTAWNNTNTQFCQGAAVGSENCNSPGVQFISNPGGELRGVWNDTSSVPQTPSDADIANAALRGVSQFGYDPNATYFVFTPTGKSTSGFGTQYCAYHSATSSSSGPVAYANMPYAPDAGSSCGQNFVNGADDSFGHGFFDGFSIVGGHEYAEAETDPQPSSGWVDATGSENGDKCAWDPSSTNVGMGSNQYAVQPLWSNATSSCVLSF